jgi:ubiquitin C
MRRQSAAGFDLGACGDGFGRFALRLCDDLEAMRDRCGFLEKEAQAEAERFRERESRIALLAAEAEAQGQRLGEGESEIGSLKAEAAMQAKRLRARDREMAFLKTEAQGQAEQLRDRDRELGALNSEAQNRADRLRECDRQISDLTAERDRLRIELNRFGPLKLFVKTPEHGVRTVEARGTALVRSVLLTLAGTLHLAVRELTLFFRGSTLFHDRFLFDYSLDDESHLDLVHTREAGDGGEIFVKMLDGCDLQLAVRYHWRVEEIREMIGEVPPEKMRLVFAGRQLEDGQCLSYYRIRRDSTIYMFLRLKG